MKKIVLFLCLVSLGFAGAKKYERYYQGTLPCAKCKGGVVTWLKVQGREYELAQKFLGVKNEYKKGKIKYIKKNTFRLDGDKKKTFKVYKTYVKHKGIKLKRLANFSTSKSNLLVNKKSILKGRANGKKIVKFEALLNHKKPTKEGYKSRKANYVLYCGTNTYGLSRVSFYKENYTLGNFVRSKENTRGKLKIKKATPLYSAYRKYCR